MAIGGALVWALNFQAVNMAVLWISGRTALVLVLWAVAAAYAWVRGHRLLAAVFALLAMWSKEEGFVIPAILSVWSIIDSREAARPLWGRVRRTLAETWMLWVAAAVSLAVRAWSGAWTPASAPSFYRYRFDLSTLLAHTYQYADRSATTPVLVFVLFWLVAGCPRFSQGTDGRRMLKGASWLVLGFAPTLLLPVRSSLYALFPSIGVVLVLSDLVEGAVSRLSQRALNRAIAFLLLLLVALFPVYKVRNRRYVREAELSAAVMREVSKVAGERGRAVVVIRDVRDARPTAEQALGGLADEAGALMTDGRVRLWIEPRARGPGRRSGACRNGGFRRARREERSGDANSVAATSDESLASSAAPAVHIGLFPVQCEVETHTLFGFIGSQRDDGADRFQEHEADPAAVHNRRSDGHCLNSELSGIAEQQAVGDAVEGLSAQTRP